MARSSSNWANSERDAFVSWPSRSSSAITSRRRATWRSAAATCRSAWVRTDCRVPHSWGAQRSLAEDPISRRWLPAHSTPLEASREKLLLQIRQTLACGALHAVERRLARWLLETADHVEADLIPVPVTQDQVAQRLGVRRTGVTLVAGRLRRAGAIRWERSRVEIRDRARLEATARSCYAALRDRTNALSASNPGFLASAMA